MQCFSIPITGVNPVPPDNAQGVGASPCREAGTFIPALTDGAFRGSG